MDSSDLRSTNSNGSMSSDISLLITPSKRDIFLSTYNRRQNFTFPNSIMHYIAKNPKNTEGYLKMIKRCKYFFIKNPILIISGLRYDYNGWQTYVNKTWKSIDTNKLLCKLWITDALSVTPANVSNDSVASSIVPKIYRCDVERLLLENQVISLNELMIICSSVEELSLEKVTVKNGDGTEVSFEKLMEKLPNIKRFFYTFATPSNNISKNTFKELWKISYLSNYHCFYLYNIPENFEIDSFYSYMKKNKNTRVSLEFSDQISEEYKARLEAIVDEIIETQNHEYKPPYIKFPGMNGEKRNILLDIFFR